MINTESTGSNFRKVPHGPLGLITLEGSREPGRSPRSFYISFKAVLSAILLRLSLCM